MREGARFGFRRNTHGADGEFRDDIPLWAVTIVENSEAGFVVHMLDPRRALSRHEVRQAVADYDAQNIDAGKTRNVDGALLTLLETGMATVEPVSSDWCAMPSDAEVATAYPAGVGEGLDRATGLIRRMAERFDGASNGKCTVCGAGRRPNGRWEFLPDDGDACFVPDPCTYDRCLSHDIRTFILNAER